MKKLFVLLLVGGGQVFAASSGGPQYILPSSEKTPEWYAGDDLRKSFSDCQEPFLGAHLVRAAFVGLLKDELQRDGVGLEDRKKVARELIASLERVGTT